MPPPRLSRSALPSPPSSTRPPGGLAGKKRKEWREAFDKEFGGNKRARVRGTRRPTKTKDMAEKLQAGAKYFKRMIDPFELLSTVVMYGIKADGRPSWAGLIKELNIPSGAEDDTEGDEDGQPEGDEDDQRDSATFERDCAVNWGFLTKAHPVFIDFVDCCADENDHKDFVTTLNKLTATADSMLYTDNHKLKQRFLDLIMPPPFDGITQSIGTDHHAWKMNGLSNPNVLELCIDWKDIPAYRDGMQDEINAAYRSIEEPKHLMATGFPSMLYDIDSVDKEIRAEGFLFSPYLIRIAKYILVTIIADDDETDEDKTSKRETVADIMDVTTVTIGFIAYTASLARHLLFGGQWVRKHQSFSYVDFFYTILGMYDEMLRSRQMDIIRFWNKSIFGNVKGNVRKRLRPEAAKPGSDAHEFLEQLRAEKEAEEEAARAMAAEEGGAGGE
ncbi:hypothetical protein PQX77_015365 [Marasmius sp. AFHP31]|nr:hypothetical protein PQX77_018309 [Marasmius sp. AFHP31]KAK1221822.1 hypothetical protein PQX77_015365 [Marasmius sp. AFHP31]